MGTQPTRRALGLSVWSRRRRLLELLCQRSEATVSELVDASGLRQPQVSKHLKVLAAAALVSARADGRYRRYHYAMSVAEHGPMAWHGTYTVIDRPSRVDADEWFVMGDADPAGPPATQTLTFEPTGEGFTLMTMQVHMPEPEDPETFMEQSAAGLGTSLAAMDELVSN